MLPLSGDRAASAAHLAALVVFSFAAAVRFAFSSRRLPCFKRPRRGGPATAAPPPPAGSVGCWFYATLACCLFLLVLQVVVIGYRAWLRTLWRDGSDLAELALPVVRALSWIVLSSWVLSCRCNAVSAFPVLLRLWWAVESVIDFSVAYVDFQAVADHRASTRDERIIADIAALPALGYLCIVAAVGSTGIRRCYEGNGLYEPLLDGNDQEPEPGCHKVLQYRDSGLIGIALMSWLSPLLAVGAKRPLELRDIPQMPHRDRPKACYKLLRSNYKRLRAASPGKEPSLAAAILKCYWREAVMTGVFAAISTIVSFVGPFMISYFVEYLSGKVMFQHEGYVLATVFFAAKLIETLSTRHWYLGVDVMGIQVKTGLTAFVYKKGLRLSSRARQSHRSGEVVNYMAVDVQRVGDFSWYLHDTWMLPLQIVLALLILYKSVGIAALATLAATVVSIVATIPVAKLQENFQDRLMTAKDERMKTTTECLRNMRILKLQAWEDRYREKLEAMRNVEYGWLRKALYAQAAVTFVFWGSPIFVAVVTFGTSILLGGQLTAGNVLTALATFRILQDPLRSFPDLVSMAAQTRVSLDRLSTFLQEEELPEDATTRLQKGTTNNAIEIKNGEFSWDRSADRPTLSGIELKVEHGMRVAICGVVGSGKSSFLSCILGEMPKLSGEVKISGTIAYVPQSPWIQSGSVEDNILFGSPMDRQRYLNVIYACSLEKDFEQLENGDKTTIGERGINLSGGQKQRIQLARALYQDADIYLLDDPFSALDAHTGSDLFLQYILMALSKKTVIYVTHQVEILPAADLILVLKDGRITQAGKYDDLQQAGTDFNALVSAHKEAIETMDITATVDEDDVSIVPQKRLYPSPSNIDNLRTDVADCDQSSDSQLSEKNKGKRNRRRQDAAGEEERARGSISRKVYLSYMTAGYKGTLMPLIILVQALFQVLQIASNWWMAWANPQTKGDKPKTSSTILLVVYMALAFGSSWFVFLRSLLVATFGLAASQKLFIKMLRSIFRAPMSFFDTTPSGRILNRVSVDQSVVDLDLAFRLAGFASTTIQLLGIVGVMSKVTWQVLALILPMAAICLWMQKYYIASSRELVRIVSIQKSPSIHLFGETIAGVATIRGFGHEKRFMKRNLYLLDCLARPLLCNLAAIEWLCLRMEFLSTFVFAFCMAMLVSFPPGTIEPSMAGLAVTYGLNLNNRLSRWILSFCKLENKIISVERIYQYSDLRSEAPLVIENCRPPSTWPESGNIDLVNLKVRYKEDSPIVLHGISCFFPGGKKIGIVGRTGSGKSTILQAIFRVIEPYEGKIVIDNIDISTIGLHDLRSRLSIIPQEPTLFEGTIRMNLDPLEEHSDHEIWEALDKCQLGEVVRMKPERLDTAVRENGENWSVGQRQLVALGRALLKHTRILVLDEATASVDSATDNLIQKIIRKEFQDCTVCTIAHRIPTVIDSDLVLVLHDGNIAEFDAPKKLLDDKSSLFMGLVTEYSRSSSIVADAQI